LIVERRERRDEIGSRVHPPRVAALENSVHGLPRVLGRTSEDPRQLGVVRRLPVFDHPAQRGREHAV
jgi:hypothetical protein